MNKIFGNRGIGKSTQLMQYAVDHNIHYIFCLNPSHHLILASEKGYDGITFLRYNDPFIDQLKEKNVPFLIDDLELFMLKKYPTLLGYTENIS